MPLSLRRGRVTRAGDDLRCEVDGVPCLVYAEITGAVQHVEEDVELPLRLDDMPVVLCTVHSQVAPVWAALREFPVAYVQVQGGALPVELSDMVNSLDLALRISVAPCFGGDARCVSVASALLFARKRADVAVCAVGPGI